MGKLKAVHLFNFSKGSRYHSMISQGLHEHPAIDASYAMPFISLGKTIREAASDLRDKLVEADLIFRCDDEHFGFDEVDRFLDANKLWGKVVYYDKKDSPALDKHRLSACLAYVKRSWPVGYDRRQRAPASRPVLPLDFAVLREYLVEPIPRTRDIDVACLFPNSPKIGKRRYAVLSELIRQKSRLGNRVLGMYTAGAARGRRALFEPPGNNPFLEYMRTLKRARIVFTAYPDNWDGDSRTWEAFASGALVFMDATAIPSAHPMVHGKHCFVYDARSVESIRKAIDIACQYLDDENSARAIAETGLENALSNHRPVNRIDKLLNWINDPVKELGKHVVLAPQAPFPAASSD